MKKVLFTATLATIFALAAACGNEYDDTKGCATDGGTVTDANTDDAATPDDANTDDDAGTTDDAATGDDTGTGTDAGTTPDASTGTDAGNTGNDSGICPGCSSGYELFVVAYTNHGLEVDQIDLNGVVVNDGGNACDPWYEPVASGYNTDQVSYERHVAENFWFFRYNTSITDNGQEQGMWLAEEINADHDCAIRADTSAFLCENDGADCYELPLYTVNVWWPDWDGDGDDEHGCSVIASRSGSVGLPNQLDCR